MDCTPRTKQLFGQLLHMTGNTKLRKTQEKDVITLVTFSITYTLEHSHILHKGEDKTHVNYMVNLLIQEKCCIL